MALCFTIILPIQIAIDWVYPLCHLYPHFRIHHDQSKSIQIQLIDEIPVFQA